LRAEHDRVALRNRPRQRAANVIDLQRRAGDERAFAIAQVAIPAGDDLGVVFGVARGERRVLTIVAQLGARVFAYRLEQKITAASFQTAGDEERFSDERVERRGLGPANVLDRLLRAIAGEDAEAREERALRRIEQLEAPIDRPEQRLLPRERGAPSAR
jgi:hypothetical protein